MGAIATLIRLNIPLVNIEGVLYIPVARLQELIEANRIERQTVEKILGNENTPQPDAIAVERTHSVPAA